MYFQPILDARTKKIVKSESLLRWKTPEIQDATPIEFIKHLENTGEIREVSFWIMDGDFIDKLIAKAQE